VKKEMDTSKQPGIKVQGILLAESVFKRIAQIPENFPIHYSVEVNNNISEDGKTLATEFRLLLNSETDPVFGNFLFVGIFTVEDEGNMPLKQFAECNAPGIIFPYIREEIHSRSMKAGLPQIILPPINIKAAIKCAPESK
jgi:preprotein translocase subunit SecB